MRDTNRYGTAHSGRVEFGRQAATVSALSPLIYVTLMVVDILVIRARTQSGAMLVGFAACFLALVGLAIGVASLVSLRHKRHDRYRPVAYVGIALSLSFFVGTFIWYFMAGRGGT